MRSRQPVVVLVFVAGLIAWTAACDRKAEQPQPPDTRAADEAAVRALSAEWAKAAAAKDLEKCVSFYAEDALRLPTGAPVEVGREAIRKDWTQLLAIPGPGFKWTTSKLEVARSGDLAYETGAYELRTNDKNGRPVTLHGKYVEVWKKQPDRSWKSVVDIDNPDQ